MQTLQIHSLPYKHTQILYKKTPSPYQTDIIPGKYEGGYKLWQCTLDLLKYMSDNELGLEGKKVIEIGCGLGLLGIAARKGGASRVVFQDFNGEVLEHCTRGNLEINGIGVQGGIWGFLSGDWDQLVPGEGMQGREADKYDLILGSELIYKQENYQKIIRLCKKYLAPGGRAILANKCYYFGVGGNMDDFKQALQKAQLPYQQCLKITPPKGGNKKQIITISLPQPTMQP